MASVLAAVAALLCLAAPALAGQDMVLGRQVAARADAPTVAATRQPRSQYLLHCAGCHGVDGAGSAAVPDMRRLGNFLRLAGGREFIIKVPGVMGSGLSDVQVAELSNWVLVTLAEPSLPAGYLPFQAAEVAQARAKPIADVGAERRRLVEQATRLGIAID